MSATLALRLRQLPPSDRLYTGDDLLCHPEWGPCELIRGKVVAVCRPNYEHGVVAAEMSFHLRLFVGQRKLGRVLSNDSGVYLERDPDTVRGPDVYFVRTQACLKGIAAKGYLPYAPDLCVEVISPNDDLPELEEKVQQYLAAGAKLVWKIDPKTRGTRVYRSDGSTEDIALAGTLRGETVLPGFELPLKELFSVLD